MKPVVFKRPQVLSDLADHFAFIAQDKLGPADRFLEVAEATFDRLAAMPLMGKRWDSPLAPLAGIRFHSMPRPFSRYVIFYLPLDAGVDILTVIRGERDLAVILERLATDE